MQEVFSPCTPSFKNCKKNIDVKFHFTQTTYMELAGEWSLTAIGSAVPSV